MNAAAFPFFLRWWIAELLAARDRVKVAVGISCSNCQSCVHLGSDSDGGEPENSIAWAACNINDRYAALRSFPFKKEMPCWDPDFWSSKFSGMIRTGSDGELDRLCTRFRSAVINATGVEAT